MQTLLYFLALAGIAFLQAWPLSLVARLGRAGGWLAFWLDARHRRVVLQNLTMCFEKEKSATEIRALAKENFRRIGENYACAIKTAGMTWEELKPRCEIVGAEIILNTLAARQQSFVLAIGHFGNFELYARLGQVIPSHQCATTYRALRQPMLNRLLQSLRGHSGCLFFERLTQFRELKNAMAQKKLILGLLADQHASVGAVHLPFFGRDCSTSAAPAVFALRYGAPLYTSFCYRIGLARWRIEAGEKILTRENGAPRSVEAIMRDVNFSFEKAIRRDPANWFWVHNRWKLSRAKFKKRKKISVTEAEVVP